MDRAGSKMVSWCAVVALTGGVLVAAPSHAASAVDFGGSVAASTPSIQAAAKPAIKPGQLRITVVGDLLGQPAAISVRGVKGPAKGTAKEVTTSTRKVVKRLKPGTYTVSSTPIIVGLKTASPQAVPRKVRLRKTRGAAITIAFVVTEVVPPTSPPPPPASTSPQPQPSPSVSDPPDTTPPGRVANLMVGERTSSSVNLTWTNPTDADLASVIVRRAVGASAPIGPQDGTAVTLASLTAQAVTDSGLSASTQYSYAVFTRDTSGNTNDSGVTVSATTQDVPDATPPGNVTDLTVVSTTDSTVDLSWKNPTDSDLAAVIVVRGDTPPTHSADGFAVPLSSPTATSVTDTGLVPGHDYYYAIFTRDALGNTNNGTSTKATTQVPVLDVFPPGPVTAVTVNASTPHSVSFSWTNPTETDFAEVVVRRAPGSTAPAGPTDGSPVVLASKTATTVQDNALDSVEEYAYSVFTKDTSGNVNTPGVVVLARTTAGVAEVGTGFYFSCALLDDGTVKCWGTNSFGQLATGDLVSRTTPTRVAGLTDVRQISVGFYHVCAVKSDSTLWCWGYNGYGELGTGNTADSSTPVQVPNVTADSVSAGRLHTCITRTGNVYCWGDNGKGQLGNGSTVSSLTPVQAIDITTATSVTAGGFHSCAAIRDGLACWGDNSSGQIGEADLNAIFSTPQPTLNVAVLSVDAGDSHTCVVFSGSDIQCWGSNSSGQLGDGTTTNRIAPVRVSGLPGSVTVPRVEASLSATCAAWSDGDAKCWGRNNRGQLGDGTTTDRHAPVTVTDMYGAAQISPGNTSTCGVTQAAAVSCWGANDKGQIGDGSVSYSGGPAQPYAIVESLQVSAGYHHTCAQLPGGALRCWGEGGSGELGNGATASSLVPVNVTGFPKATAIAAGMFSTCASNIGERLACWGDNSYGQLGSGTNPTVLPRSPDPLVVPGIGAVVSAVLGGGHGCLLRSNDELKCWGSNVRGQVGDGTTTRRDWPEDILQSVATASAGYSHTCAVTKAGLVWCWGDGAYGALGSIIPSPFYRTTPIQVPGISGATAVSAGKFVSCALLVDGTVKCWGLNFVGQLGNPAVVGTSSASPVTVSLPSRAVALTSGEEGSCAVLTGGDVFCWGRNSNGQLGRNPSILNWSATPLKVEGIAKAVHISGTRGHICATLAGGGLKCWGANSSGQLGNNSVSSSYVPVWVQGFAQ